MMHAPARSIIWYSLISYQSTCSCSVFRGRDYVCPQDLSRSFAKISFRRCDVSWQSVINVNRSNDFFSITHVYTCLLIILIGFLTVAQIWKIREMEPSPIALVFPSPRSKASFLLKFPPKFVDVLLTYLVKTLPSFSDNFLTRCYAICYVHRIVSSIAIFISY